MSFDSDSSRNDSSSSWSPAVEIEEEIDIVENEPIDRETEGEDE